MIDLDPKYLRIVLEILEKHLSDHTVWAYGSRIKGTSHTGSDLDLVVMPSGRNNYQNQLSAARDAFSESNLPILIDIMDWETIPEKFQREIEKVHEVLQSN